MKSMRMVQDLRSRILSAIPTSISNHFVGTQSSGGNIAPALLCTWSGRKADQIMKTWEIFNLIIPLAGSGLRTRTTSSW
jgi:hypothetical protein